MAGTNKSPFPLVPVPGNETPVDDEAETASHDASGGGATADTDDRPVVRLKGRKLGPRSVARLAAVQALYQMDVAQTDRDDVIDQFIEHRFRNERAQEIYAGADRRFFSAIVRGVVDRQRDVDPIINEQLRDGWRLSRLDSILRAVLRAATYELVDKPDVPGPVIINEYVDVAHAFFEGEEPRVVNGVLDRLNKKLRAGEPTTKPKKDTAGPASEEAEQEPPSSTQTGEDPASV